MKNTLNEKRKKLLKEYIKGYFPKEKDCDICVFSIPVLELLMKDIKKQDKEFIKNLKYYFSADFEVKIINKLAGKDLI